MLKLLFLDIDGVLNDHTQQSNGYCGVGQKQVDNLNRVLDEVPDLQLVISSSWRYMMSSGQMTLVGFSNLLCTHGVKAHRRIHGKTEPDETVCTRDRSNFCVCRSELISRYLEAHKPDSFVVLDDGPLEVPNFVLVDGSLGLTNGDVTKALRMLGLEELP